MSILKRYTVLVYLIGWKPDSELYTPKLNGGQALLLGLARNRPITCLEGDSVPLYCSFY